MDSFRTFRGYYSRMQTGQALESDRALVISFPSLSPYFMLVNKLYYNSFIQAPKSGLTIDFFILVLQICIQNLP